MPNKVRIDKWLWAVRIFKTRTIATEACKSGKVKVGDKKVKASYLLEPGTTVSIFKKEKMWVVRAQKLIVKRVSASIANECFDDLSPEPEPSDKMPSFFYKTNELREKGSGRPTKKERRTIDRLKDSE